MKNILKYISLLFLGAAAVSCDFEDMPFDKYDSDFVFSNDKKAEGYVLGVYLGLPFDKSDENGYNRVDGAMLASASDEAMITVPGSSIVFLTDGSLTPRKSNPDGCWENNYKFIRDANIGIVGLEKLPEANHDLKLQLQAELKFLKAFFYFELVKRYGGVPLIDRAYELSDDLNVPRSSFAACVDYIAGLCDESYTDLPAPNNVNFGRASKGAALALKARLLLYAASPLYNGKGYDGSDNEFICYGSYDKKRWESAAAAAAEVIKLGDYDIYKPTPVAETDRDEQVIASGSANYRKLFTVITGNKELILPRTSKVGNRVEIQNFPVGIPNGKGLTSPSQQMDSRSTIRRVPTTGRIRMKTAIRVSMPASSTTGRTGTARRSRPFGAERTTTPTLRPGRGITCPNSAAARWSFRERPQTPTTVSRCSAMRSCCSTTPKPSTRLTVPTSIRWDAA